MTIIGLILVGAFVAFVCKLLMADSKPSRRSRDSGLDRVKTNAKIDTAAVLAGEDSRWDRYLGMTAAMTQESVPTATLECISNTLGRHLYKRTPDFAMSR